MTRRRVALGLLLAVLGAACGPADPASMPAPASSRPPASTSPQPATRDDAGALFPTLSGVARTGSAPFPRAAASPPPADLPEGVEPSRLVIPAIGVDAEVVDLGLNDDNSVEVPEDYSRTGWVRHTPSPGQLGSSVIVGHIDSTEGPAVFHRLDQLRAGDRIQVRGDDGNLVVFAVDSVDEYPKAAFPFRDVFGYVRQPALRLVTCGGPFNRVAGSYEHNLVVSAHRTDVGS